MPAQRGLVPPAILTSTLVLVLCSVGWGALGVISVDETVPNAVHRYLTVMLATLTICAAMVHLAARIMRALARNLDAISSSGDDGYAAGYTDGLAARPAASPVSPAVSRLVRTPR